MKGLIEYSDLGSKTLAATLQMILSSPKLNYGEMSYANLQVGAIPNNKITEEWESKVFGYGVYVVFDDVIPVYVGMSDTNFKHRFQSHRFFDGRPHFGFNKLARKIAEIKFQDINLAMNKDSFYGAVMSEMNKLNVVRINLSESNVPASKCSRIENLLRKSFSSTIYNPLKSVRGFDLNAQMNELIK
jgi:hypothetical protein